MKGKFAWAGNGIAEEQMRKLYLLKQTTKIPITKLIGMAVDLLLEKFQKEISTLEQVEIKKRKEVIKDERNNL